MKDPIHIAHELKEILNRLRKLLNTLNIIKGRHIIKGRSHVTKVSFRIKFTPAPIVTVKFVNVPNQPLKIINYNQKYQGIKPEIITTSNKNNGKEAEGHFKILQRKYIYSIQNKNYA